MPLEESTVGTIDYRRANGISHLASRNLDKVPGCLMHIDETMPNHGIQGAIHCAPTYFLIVSVLALEDKMCYTVK